jgi:hypothetical protein
MTGVLLMFYESDVACLGFGQSAGKPDHYLAVTQNPALHQFRQLSHSNAHERSFLP